MKTWLTRDEALELLKVRPQTLYAYVSRGQIGMRPDPDDPRRSLYRAADISGLTRRRERGKRPAAIAASTIAWGEPIITTAISTVLRGRLYYRGRDVAELAETATLEEAAALLWDSSGLVRFRFNGQRPQGRGPARSRAFVALAAAAAAGEPIHGRLPTVLREEAPLVATEVAVALGASAESDAPIHSRLASTWRKNRRTPDLIRRALVLHADQELNSSTFAARVAASTGASLAACVLSGFATLSGTAARRCHVADSVADGGRRANGCANGDCRAFGIRHGNTGLRAPPLSRRRPASVGTSRRVRSAAAIRAHDGDGENRDRTATQSRLCAARNVAAMRTSARRAVLIVRAWTLRRLARACDRAGSDRAAYSSARTLRRPRVGRCVDTGGRRACRIGPGRNRLAGAAGKPPGIFNEPALALFAILLRKKHLAQIRRWPVPSGGWGVPKSGRPQWATLEAAVVRN
jgi:hypothetical protein